MAERTQGRAGGWVVKRGLSEADLISYVEERQITRERMISVTEPKEGRFTLIFEGTAEQHGEYVASIAEQEEALGKIPWGESVPIRYG